MKIMKLRQNNKEERVILDSIEKNMEKVSAQGPCVAQHLGKNQCAMVCWKKKAKPGTQLAGL